MKQLKISFFSLSLKKGGAENQLVKLALFLKNKANFDVNILYFVNGNDFEEVLKESNIEYQFFNIKKIKGFIKLFKHIKKQKPNLLISFMFGANIIARLIKFFLKTSLITSVRNNEISKIYKIIYKITYRLDNCTTFNSKYALDKFIKEKITNVDKSILINNAIQVLPIKPLVRTNDIYTLVSIAHFRPQKDYKTLFEAISILKEENVPVKLYVLGHLYDQTWPYELIKELNIEQEIEMVGFTQDTQKYIDKSDALVLSSLWEGTPNAILEGMANYLPIIASNIPGSYDLVTNAKCGVFFETQNPTDLKNKIIETINYNKSKASELGFNGYNYVLENYESDNVHKKWLSVINSVLNEI